MLWMLICPYLSCKARKADNFLFFRQFTYSFKAAPYTECGFAVILCLYLPPTPSTPNLKKENLAFATGRTVLPSPMLRRCRSGAAHARQNRRGRARVFRFAAQNERAALQSRACLTCPETPHTSALYRLCIPQTPRSRSQATE